MNIRYTKLYLYLLISDSELLAQNLSSQISGLNTPQNELLQSRSVINPPTVSFGSNPIKPSDFISPTNIVPPFTLSISTQPSGVVLSESKPPPPTTPPSLTLITTPASSAIIPNTSSIKPPPPPSTSPPPPPPPSPSTSQQKSTIPTTQQTNPIIPPSPTRSETDIGNTTIETKPTPTELMTTFLTIGTETTTPTAATTTSLSNSTSPPPSNESNSEMESDNYTTRVAIYSVVGVASAIILIGLTVVLFKKYSLKPSHKFAAKSNFTTWGAPPPVQRPSTSQQSDTSTSPMNPNLLRGNNTEAVFLKQLNEP